MDTSDMAALILPVPSQPSTLGETTAVITLCGCQEGLHRVMPRNSIIKKCVLASGPWRVQTTGWCASHVSKPLCRFQVGFFRVGQGLCGFGGFSRVFGVLWRKGVGVVALISQWKNAQRRLIAHVGCATCKKMCNLEHGVQSIMI